MTETEVEAGPRASPVARAALLAYLLLIVYASWFPFSGWRSSGLSPFAFLVLQMPRWWTGFDVMVNIVGYMPFGILIVLALHPRVRGLWAVAIAAVVGLLVSVACWCFLEAVHELQDEVYEDLPGRLGFEAVPSWWPLPWLVLAGLLTAFAIERLPGHGGHVPAHGLKTDGELVRPEELPGILLAAAATCS